MPRCAPAGLSFGQLRGQWAAWALWIATAACGGNQPSAASASKDTRESSTFTEHAAADKSDSLEAFRTKLAAGITETELDLAAKGWGADLAALLANSPKVAELHSLDVSDNDLGPSGARALAGGGHWNSLRELDLGGNDIDDEGATAIAHAPGFSALETLNVSGNSIAGSGALAIAQGEKPGA